MKKKYYKISESIQILRANLYEIARVSEWASYMGYDNTSKFAYRFLRHFKVRPLKVLNHIRLANIVQMLKSEKYSNLYIAHKHGLPDEKALYNYINYHFDCSPTKIKGMRLVEIEKKFKKFGNKIHEEIQGMKII